MRIIMGQTASRDDLGDYRCCICEHRFYLGSVTCRVIMEEHNAHWGDACPACLERGPEHIQERLNDNARWARRAAQEADAVAREGISDCPTLEEFLVAEAFYQRPRFDTGEEYERARSRGELD